MCAPAASIAVEIADTEQKRELGLMYRTSLPRRSGMIFVFDRDQPVYFWMKNTLIPLDMVFAGADGRVRSIAANVPASALHSADEAVARRNGRAKYVLELNGGEASADGLTPGKTLGLLLSRTHRSCQ